MAEQTPVVIIDNGSYRLRAGFQSDAAPRVVVPSLVGSRRNAGIALAAGQRQDVVGTQAWRNRGILSCSEPVHGGVTQSWPDVERLWSDVVYRELRVAPENFCFIVTEPPNNTAANKEAALEALMETFNARSCFLGNTAVLSLYSYGLSTGVVVDSGLHGTTCVPVHEGYALGRHTTSTDVAGAVLTDRLGSLLDKLGYAFSTTIEVDVVNAVKESLCHVRPSDADEPAGPEGAGFTLPDGQFIPLSNEMIDTTEALFDFSVLGGAHDTKVKVYEDSGAEFHPTGVPKGISWLTYGAIYKCEPALRRRLFSNVVLGGGSTLFAGMRERLSTEMRQLYRQMHPGERVADIAIDALECRQFSAWLGGAMLSQLSMFPHLTVSKQEYEEHGKSVIHFKNL
jgi:actin beta/gamma 1